MVFPLGYLPRDGCALCCLWSPLRPPYAQSGVLWESCYKCTFPSHPLRGPHSGAWVDFLQVLQVILLPVGIRPYLEKFSPGSSHSCFSSWTRCLSRLLGGSVVHQCFAHRPWALGGGTGGRSMSMGGGSLGAWTEKSLTCLVVHALCCLLECPGHVLALSNL